jgi:hypothetical protein
MFESADPMASIGYLLAAGGLFVGSLAAYAVLTARRLTAARARNQELRARP